ncbi:MAG: CBS domain-containing protein [Halolamina sp.]|uniref:CBS domain-containing protein n=1 Tax=Halolamina sp. TaxID=1940283 RepID=UPI002FC33503
MDDIFVAQLMTTDLKTVVPGTLVEDAADLMLDETIGSVVVVNDAHEIEGILTRTDFVDIVAGQKPKDQTPVSAYMTPDVLTAEAGETIRTVADRMVEAGIHHVPVVDDDEVIGIITTTDLTGYLSTVQTPSP